MATYRLLARRWRRGITSLPGFVIEAWRWRSFRYYRRRRIRRKSPGPAFGGYWRVGYTAGVSRVKMRTLRRWRWQASHAVIRDGGTPLLALRRLHVVTLPPLLATTLVTVTTNTCCFRCYRRCHAPALHVERRRLNGLVILRGGRYAGAIPASISGE